MLEEGTTFHARHPIEIDPYFSYNDHEVTIRIPERRQSSLWSTDLNEDWFNLNRTKIVLFFLQKPDGSLICLDFFLTRLGGAITLEGIPDQIVRNSLKQLLNVKLGF